MAESLGDAILYLRTDDSALTGGISKAKGEAQGLASDFDASAARIVRSTNSVGTAATGMAAAAQASAKAAVAQAAGFEAVAAKAQLSTLAMRETLVVTRELARGNFTRIPGSLTLLAQGVGSSGGFAAYGKQLLSTIGIIKVYQDAELAAEAATTAASAAAVRSAAQRAGAGILAADTEMALAEAAARTAVTSEEEAAAQAMLAAAHQAVTAAAAEAAIAENALAVAEERAMTAAAASKEATTVGLGATGAALIGVGIAISGALLGFEALRTEVSDTGVLESYARSLGLTSEQFDELKAKTDDFALTWGDVWNGIKKAAEDALDQSDAWQNFKQGNESAFSAALQHAVDFAAGCEGAVKGAYDTIIQQWQNFPAAFGDMFYSGVNKAIDALNTLVKHGTDLLNGFIADANKLPFVSIGKVGAPQISNVANPYAGAASRVASSLGANVASETAAARAQIEKNIGTVYGDIIGAAEKRIAKDAPKPPKGRAGRSPSGDDGSDNSDKQDATFNEDMATLQAEYAAALKSQVKGVLEQLGFQEEEVRAEQQKRDDSYQAAVVSGRLTQAQADILKSAEASVTAEKLKAIEIQKQVETIKEQAALDQQESGYKIDALKFAESMATSQAERRQLELDIIDATYQEKQEQLQSLLLIAIKNQDLAQQNLLRGQINELPAQKAREQATAYKNTEDPLHQWMSSIPQDARSITEALQGIEVQGFNGLASAIAGVVSGTESMRQAFTQLAQSVVSDLVEMIEKMLIFRALSSILGGFDQSSFASTVASNDQWVSSTLADGLQNMPAASLPGFATGGFIPIGGLGGVDKNLLSINGQPRAMVSADETLAVVPKTGFAANSNSAPAKIELVVSGNDLWQVQVGHVANAVVDMKTPGIVQQAKTTTVRQLTKRKIGG